MAVVKKGDLVRLEYTGKTASTGQVFDTTDESIAKKAGIYEEPAIYGPRLAVFGSGAIIPGIEEAIAHLQVGKAENFLIEPKKAFGEKSQSLLRMMPEKEFAKQNVRAAPGMLLTLDGIPALVKSVTSGRVVVDFNHPLAGESVLYSVKLHEVISDPKKKAEAILAANSLTGEISQGEGGRLTVLLKGAPSGKLEAAKRTIASAVPGAEVKEA